MVAAAGCPTILSGSGPCMIQNPFFTIPGSYRLRNKIHVSGRGMACFLMSSPIAYSCSLTLVELGDDLRVFLPMRAWMIHSIGTGMRLSKWVISHLEENAQLSLEGQKSNHEADFSGSRSSPKLVAPWVKLWHEEEFLSSLFNSVGW